MKFIFAPLILIVLTLTVVSAQDNYPITHDLQVITSENADQLKPLAQMGGVTPLDVSWSPNGQTLLATTDEGAYRYQLNKVHENDFFA